MEKIWLKSYPPGVSENVPTPRFRSIREMIEHSFQEYPDNPAYTNMGTTITYRDLDELSMQFACYLQKMLDLTRGERVAIVITSYSIHYTKLYEPGARTRCGSTRRAEPARRRSPTRGARRADGAG